MTQLTNFTFDELTIGQTASLSRKLTYKDLQAFAYVSGDVNPIHLDEAYAAETPFKKVIAHGMWSASLISCALGTRLPGVGTVYTGQTLKFRRPVYLDDTLTVTLTVTEKDEAKKRVTLACEVTNQEGELVVKGDAEVIAPSEKITCDAATLPDIQVIA